MARLLERFGRNERGSVAIIFSLMVLPVLGIVATAIDYGRTSHYRMKLQNAGDAAISAVSGRLADDPDEIAATVRALLVANLRTDLRELPYTLKIASDKSSIELGFRTKVSTTLLSLMGVNSIEVATTSRVGQTKAPTALPRGLPSGPHPFDTSPLASGLPIDQRRLQESVEALQRSLPLGGGLGGAALGGMNHSDLQDLGRQLRQLEQPGGAGLDPGELQRILEGLR